MASGKSLELAKLRRRPITLTPSARGVFARVGPTHTYTRDELDAARRKVRAGDLLRASKAAIAWARAHGHYELGRRP